MNGATVKNQVYIMIIVLLSISCAARQRAPSATVKSVTEDTTYICENHYQVILNVELNKMTIMGAMIDKKKNVVLLRPEVTGMAVKTMTYKSEPAALIEENYKLSDFILTVRQPAGDKKYWLKKSGEFEVSCNDK